MSVLLDTNVLVGAKVPGDPLHAPSVLALERAMKGQWGRPAVSDYIVDEAVTLARARTRSHQAADDLAAFLLGEPPHEPVFEVIPVDRAAFTLARALFRRYDDRFLSFTDCTTLALAQHLDLRVLSFDRGFDGLAPRLDPSSLPQP